MTQTYLWPNALLMFIGIVIIFAFPQFLVMSLGFILCAIGTARLIFHWTVDSHIKI